MRTSWMVISLIACSHPKPEATQDPVDDNRVFDGMWTIWDGSRKLGTIPSSGAIRAAKPGP